MPTTAEQTHNRIPWPDLQESAQPDVTVSSRTDTTQPTDDLRSAAFRAALLAHFRAARDKSIAEQASPVK